MDKWSCHATLLSSFMHNGGGVCTGKLNGNVKQNRTKLEKIFENSTVL